MNTMDYELNPTVQMVKDSMMNLIKLGEISACGQPETELESLRSEVKKTVLWLFAAIVASDSKYAEGERLFLELVVGLSEKPSVAARDINEYSKNWSTAATRVPRFYQTALAHDTRMRTDVARTVIRELQFIGSCACVSDGQFDPTEHELVRNYVNYLEDYALVWLAQSATEKARDVEGWTRV
jgi:tellurite resistance protein